MQVFDDALDSMLGECRAIGLARGGEYRDTWHLANIVTTHTAGILRTIGEDRSPEALRLVLLSALVDVKASRIVAGGDYKRDSFVDGVNYLAVLGELLGEYRPKERPAP